MTQSWGPPPGYPPPRPPRPQYQLTVPEPNYDDYYVEGDPPLKRALYFLAGSCATSLLVGMCICALALFWVVDDRLGITTSDQTGVESTNLNPPLPPVESQPVFQPTAPLVQPQTIPTEQPAQPQEQAPPPPEENVPMAIGDVVQTDDTGIELIVFDIQRNVQPVNLQTPDGTEFVAVSIQLENVEVDNTIAFSINDFQLEDGEKTTFTPNADADNGRRLTDGELPPGDSVEGDLLFHVPLGHTPLTLAWQVSGSDATYFVILQ